MDAYDRWVHDSDGDEYEPPSMLWLAVVLCSPLAAIVLHLI